MIFIVTGHTGEYSDSTQWPVLAYAVESEADRHALFAEKRAIEIKKTYDAAANDEKEPNEFDPNMKMDYTGTRYFVQKVEFCEGPFVHG